MHVVPFEDDRPLAPAPDEGGRQPPEGAKVPHRLTRKIVFIASRTAGGAMDVVRQALSAPTLVVSEHPTLYSLLGQVSARNHD